MNHVFGLCAPVMPTSHTTTPKVRAASKSATVQIELPLAARRLAYQLGTTPEKIVAKALRLGLRSIDWNLADRCKPYADGTDKDGFDITKAMDRLSPQKLAALCEGDEPPQEILLVADCRRKGVIPWLDDDDPRLLRGLSAFARIYGKA